MGKSRLLVAGTALAIGLFAGGSPQAAVGGGAAFEVARGVGAGFSDGSLFAEAFGFDGLVLTTGPGVVESQFGCAVVGTSAPKGVRPTKDHSVDGRIDVGCGRLRVTVDPLLGTGGLKGTLRSWVYDYETGEEVPSKITVDLSFSGMGLVRPILSESEFVDTQILPPTAFLFAAVGAGAGRRASAKGAIVSETLGPVVNGTDQGVIFEGVNAYLDAYVF